MGRSHASLAIADPPTEFPVVSASHHCLMIHLCAYSMGSVSFSSLIGLRGGRGTACLLKEDDSFVARTACVLDPFMCLLLS